MQGSGPARGRQLAIGSGHLAWHSRGYHPHLDAAYVTQHITFRLADSVPASLINRWRAALHGDRAAEMHRRIAKYEDAGRGACHLRRPEIARLVQDALLRFDRKRYRLLDWCVMPNHVHVLIEQAAGVPLHKIVHSWKGYTSRQANAQLNRNGAFWMRDYFDRYVRSPEQFNAIRYYIQWNPVRAGLCDRPEHWPWSSAGWRAKR
ncbi:MAG: transposase [Acidobacteria bacterium]|nr:transposase [Acidobacteriota bacterium]MXZ71380.1 transposase [Acidobacteriota bacterium]MYD70525.1 transposase [Acidobacteriota bacterium]MYJ05968.1 transposase [Acidobacteriota bacterium]